MAKKGVLLLALLLSFFSFSPLVTAGQPNTPHTQSEVLFSVQASAKSTVYYKRAAWIFNRSSRYFIVDVPGSIVYDSLVNTRYHHLNRFAKLHRQPFMYPCIPHSGTDASSSALA